MSTTQQLDLLDYAAAQEAKQAGMAQAMSNAGSVWKVIATNTARDVLMRQPLVSADDLRSACPMQPRHSNAWGPFITALVKRGWMEPTGRRVVSRQKQGHCNEIREYRSLLYGYRAEVGA